MRAVGDWELDAVHLFVGLIGAASLIALLVRRVAVPYTVALVVFGLAAAFIAPQLEFVVTPDIVLAWLLPGLLFEAAYRTDFEVLRRSFLGIAVLAAPGVLVSAAVVTIVLNLATGLPLHLAFIVGAMLSATDPAAVIATFRRVDAPPRLAALVEGESLFNDGTAIVVFAIALQALRTDIGPVDGVFAFVSTVVLSGVIGLVGGYVASRLIAMVDDHLVELTLSLTAAYGTYLVADAFHESGVIATVVAGIVIGSYGRRVGMSERTRDALDTVWEFLAFLLTALVFLLVGLAISIPELVAAGPWIAWAVVGTVLGRAVVTYLLLGGASRLRAIRRGQRPLSAGWLHILFWSGLRGAVAVALALSLPADTPERGLLQATTFGVVLFTLLVQGSSVELVVRRSLRGRASG
jgi:CPA1 family monovalent cation:H+ antiporter